MHDLQALWGGGSLRADSLLGEPLDLPLPAQRLGRDKQVADLLAAHGQACARDAQGVGTPTPHTAQPVLVLVDGLAGSGKSAVVRDATEAETSAGTAIMAGADVDPSRMRPI